MSVRAVDTRLLIASDVRLYSEGLSTRVASTAGLIVCDVVADAAAVCATLDHTEVDVVLIDMSMADSLEAVRAVRARSPRIGIIGLCVPEIEDIIIPGIMAGLTGYLPRHGSIEQLISLINCVARGEATAAPHIIASIFRRLSAGTGEPAPERASALSARELQIVHMLEAGCSNKQIAKELQIRLPTVKKHVHTIFAKLHVERRSQVAQALRDRRARYWETILQEEPESMRRAPRSNLPRTNLLT